MKKIEKVCYVCGKRIQFGKKGGSYSFDPLARRYFHLECKFGSEAGGVVRTLAARAENNFAMSIEAIKSAVARGDDEELMDFFNEMCATFFTKGMSTVLNLLKEIALEVKDEAREYKH